jgi:hypothetical protein
MGFAYENYNENRTIDFRWKGYSGMVHVNYSTNTDPDGIGYDHMETGFSPYSAIGFPKLTCTIDYEGKGYHSYMGWIQTVRFNPGTSYHYPAISPEPMFVYHIPMMLDADTPFCVYGVDPALFEAPASNLDGIQWIANTYLSASKNLIVSREICIILGIQWGYSITNGTIVHAEMKTLKLGGELFLRDLAILHRDYPRWRFSICAEQDGFND